jgi:sulfite reductase (ferredoxin)
MAENQEPTNNLIHLGAGVGSKVEHIKGESNYLRGRIVEELQQDTPRFAEEQVQLLKFHGTYQQEDRDLRQARKAAGAEKAYQFMVRARIPGGRLTAEQYLAEDDLAGRYGNGGLRLTTRQSIQLHGVLKGNLRATIHEINLAQLSTLSACGDVNRNVMACPAPASGPARARVHEISHAIAMHLAPHSKAYHEIWVDGEKVEGGEEEDFVEPIYGTTYLPRKFKIGVAFPNDNCIDVYTQDIGLVADLEGEPGSDDERLLGFHVLIGGGMGMTHGKADTYPHLALPLCYATPEELIEIIETIVTVQRDYGDRQNRKHARMKYVVAERGIPWFRAEVESRLGRKLQDARAISWNDSEDHLGWHPQGDGRWFVGIYVENGRVRDRGDFLLRQGLRTVIDEFRPNVRLTAQQNILLVDIPQEQRPAIEARLAEFGIVSDPQKLGLRRLAMACPALPTCGLAVAEAERVIPALVTQVEEQLRELGLGNELVSIRMTGCPNGCARPYMGDIGIVGRTKDIYNIYIGGDQPNTRLTTLYTGMVHFSNLAATLRPLLEIWRDERQVDEKFGDFCYRVGVDYLRARASAGQQVAEAHAHD